MDKSWMILFRERLSPRYRAGVDAFIEFAKANAGGGSMIRCPCNKCMNFDWREFDIVQGHLVQYGIMVSYKIWSHHGEHHDNQLDYSDDDSDGSNDDDRDEYPKLLQQSQLEVTSLMTELEISVDVLGRRSGYLNGYGICYKGSSSTRTPTESAERDAEVIALKEQVAMRAEQTAAQAKKHVDL